MADTITHEGQKNWRNSVIFLSLNGPDAANMAGGAVSLRATEKTVQLSCSYPTDILLIPVSGAFDWRSHHLLRLNWYLDASRPTLPPSSSSSLFVIPVHLLLPSFPGYFYIPFWPKLINSLSFFLSSIRFIPVLLFIFPLSTYLSPYSSLLLPS